MTNKLEIDRKLAERLERALNQVGVQDHLCDYALVANMKRELRALLAAPVVERQEPVPLTAVAVLRDDEDGGLEPEWLLEGGTAELFEGAVLLIADLDQTLCEEDGHCTLYREQPAPVAVVSLRNFANAMIDIALEGCDADGAQIQELAVEHGLLKPEHRTERCGDACSCAEYADFPVECFRKADELNQSSAS
jgi:hypothetical protein